MLVEMQVRSTDTVPDLPYLMGEAGRGVGLLPVRRTGSRVVERVDCLERIGEIWVGDLWWVRAALYLT